MTNHWIWQIRNKVPKKEFLRALGAEAKWYYNGEYMGRVKMKSVTLEYIQDFQKIK